MTYFTIPYHIPSYSIPYQNHTTLALHWWIDMECPQHSSHWPAMAIALAFHWWTSASTWFSTKVRICMFLSFLSRQFSTKVLKARLCWKLRFPRPTLFLHGNNVAATCLWIWFKTGTTQHCEIMEQRAACESPNTPALFLTHVSWKMAAWTKCLESGSFYQWPGNWHFWHQVLGISSHSTHCSQALSWESRSCLSST